MYQTTSLTKTLQTSSVTLTLEHRIEFLLTALQWALHTHTSSHTDTHAHLAPVWLSRYWTRSMKRNKRNRFQRFLSLFQGQWRNNPSGSIHIERVQKRKKLTFFAFSQVSLDWEFTKSKLSLDVGFAIVTTSCERRLKVCLHVTPI